MHPADDEMKANFIAHREAFHRLASMVMKDSFLESLDFRDVRQDSDAPALPASRVQEYRTLLKQVGCQSLGTYSTESGEKLWVGFVYSEISCYTDGTTKGYRYTPDGRLYKEDRPLTNGWSIFVFFDEHGRYDPDSPLHEHPSQSPEAKPAE